MSMNKVEFKKNLRIRLIEGVEETISAGVLIKCTKTDKILLLLRSEICDVPNTWNLVAGGINKGETPLEGLKREVTEEMQIDADIIDYKFIENEDYKGTPFHYYEGFTSSEFIPTLDHENTAFRWVDKNSLPSPLFPKLKGKIDKIYKI